MSRRQRLPRELLRNKNKILKNRRKARKGFFSYSKSAIISFAMMELGINILCSVYHTWQIYKRDMNEDQKNEDSNYR